MSTKSILIPAVIAVLAVAGISAVALNQPKPPMIDKIMSKTSDVMMKKEGDKMMDKKSSWSPAEMEKMMKEEAMMMSKMSPEEKAAFEKLTPEQKMEKEKMMMKDGVSMDGVMKKDDAMMKKEEVVMSKTGYIDYSPQALAANSAGKNIIFFKANWCSTCKAVDSDIVANSTKIPTGVNIMKVDYDNSTDLKKKYGVTIQHTFVVVDKDGNQIAKSQGQPTLESVLALIK